MRNEEPGIFMPRCARSGDELPLAMQQLFLTGRILPAGARLVVQHRFQSAARKPLEVVYTFLLPRDAALRRFEVQGPGFKAHSELQPPRQAQENYERGVAAGHLSVLARGYRDGMVNLSLGNLNPQEEVLVALEILAGVDLRDDGFRFRFPFTLAPSYHPDARAILLEDQELQMELPADRFDDLLLPAFRKSARGLHQIGFEVDLDVPWGIEEIGSPSHSIRVCGSRRVILAPAADLPDRDLVLDVRSEMGETRLLSGQTGDGRRHFAALIPSTHFGVRKEAARNVVFLMDRSGSMSGEPIAQARKALAACLAVLGAEDRFGLVAFDDRCETFSAELKEADPRNRRAARDFLTKIDARGGTELAAGIREAAAMISGRGGDIFILTDGQVFETEGILQTARRAGCRLHSLGIGSASQDRFLALLARETDGISRFVTPRERVDQAALDLFASVACPVAVGFRVEGLEPSGGRWSPEPSPSVFPGCPVLLYGDCVAGTDDGITIRYSTAAQEAPGRIVLSGADSCCGETLRLLRGARRITDAEARLESDDSAIGRRTAARQEEYLAALSREYSLASRSMSLVAVVERAGDRPGEPPVTQVVPLGLSQDMVLEETQQIMYCLSAPEAAAPPSPVAFSCALPMMEESAACMNELPAWPTDFDRLMDLSIRIEPDGGMPGEKEEERILVSLLLLLAFLANGDDLRSGAFRSHVARLVDFLERELPAGLPEEKLRVAKETLRRVRERKPAAGPWMDLAEGMLPEKAHRPVEEAWAALSEKDHPPDSGTLLR